MPRSLREWITVLWPAFVAACVLEMLVFAGFDPHDVQLFGQTLPSDREQVYTLAFLAFWLVTTVSGLITWVLARPMTMSNTGSASDEANSPGAGPTHRP